MQHAHHYRIIFVEVDHRSHYRIVLVNYTKVTTDTIGASPENGEIIIGLAYRVGNHFAPLY